MRTEVMDSLLNIKINKTYLCPVYFFPLLSVAVSPKMLKQKGCCAYISIFLYLISWTSTRRQMLKLFQQKVKIKESSFDSAWTVFKTDLFYSFNVVLYYSFTFMHTLNNLYTCKIWGFHSGDYEECRLLGCVAM
jgi:hypothetical protein